MSWLGTGGRQDFLTKLGLEVGTFIGCQYQCKKYNWNTFRDTAWLHCNWTWCDS